jgi:hypothetical protein
MASESDPHGRRFASILTARRARHPLNFWTDPALIFFDCNAVYLGVDFLHDADRV